MGDAGPGPGYTKSNHRDSCRHDARPLPRAPGEDRTGGQRRCARDRRRSGRVAERPFPGRGGSQSRVSGEDSGDRRHARSVRGTVSHHGVRPLSAGTVRGAGSPRRLRSQHRIAAALRGHGGHRLLRKFHRDHQAGPAVCRDHMHWLRNVCRILPGFGRQ